MCKYRGTVAAPNAGSLYGIPFWGVCQGVIKFDLVLSKAINDIRPDLDYRSKWCNGAIRSDSVGAIYCPPYSNNGEGVLKIDISTDTVAALGENLFPQRQGWGTWESVMCYCSRWMHLLRAIEGVSYHEVGSESQ